MNIYDNIIEGDGLQMIWESMRKGVPIKKTNRISGKTKYEIEFEKLDTSPPINEKVLRKAQRLAYKRVMKKYGLFGKENGKFLRAVDYVGDSRIHIPTPFAGLTLRVYDNDEYDEFVDEMVRNGFDEGGMDGYMRYSDWKRSNKK